MKSIFHLLCLMSNINKSLFYIFLLILVSSSCKKEVQVKTETVEFNTSPYSEKWEIIYLPEDNPLHSHRIHAPTVLGDILMYVHQNKFSNKDSLVFVDKSFNPIQINSGIILHSFNSIKGVLEHNNLYYIYGNFEFQDIYSGVHYENIFIYNPIDKTLTGTNLPFQETPRQLTVLNDEIVMLSVKNNGEVLIEYLNSSVIPDDEFPNTQPQEYILRISEHNGNFLVINLARELQQVDLNNLPYNVWNTLNFNGENSFQHFIHYKDKLLAVGSFNDGAHHLVEIDYENEQLIPIVNNSNKIDFESLIFHEGTQGYQITGDEIIFSNYFISESLSGVPYEYGKYVVYDGASLNIHTENPSFNYVLNWNGSIFGFGGEVKIARRKF